MTRRTLLHTLTASGLLAALPATTAAPAPAAVAELRRLAGKLAAVRAEKVQSVQAQDYECASRMRNIEKQLQEQLAACCLAL